MNLRFINFYIQFSFLIASLLPASSRAEELYLALKIEPSESLQTVMNNYLTLGAVPSIGYHITLFYNLDTDSIRSAEDIADNINNIVSNGIKDHGILFFPETKIEKSGRFLISKKSDAPGNLPFAKLWNRLPKKVANKHLAKPHISLRDMENQDPSSVFLDKINTAYSDVRNYTLADGGCSFKIVGTYARYGMKTLLDSHISSNHQSPAKNSPSFSYPTVPKGFNVFGFQNKLLADTLDMNNLSHFPTLSSIPHKRKSNNSLEVNDKKTQIEMSKENVPTLSSPQREGDAICNHKKEKEYEDNCLDNYENKSECHYESPTTTPPQESNAQIAARDTTPNPDIESLTSRLNRIRNGMISPCLPAENWTFLTTVEPIDQVVFVENRPQTYRNYITQHHWYNNGVFSHSSTGIECECIN